MGRGGVLTRTKDKTTTVSAVLAHSLTFNQDTEFCIVRDILPCWYGRKLGFGQALCLCMEGFGESMAAFTGARKLGFGLLGEYMKDISWFEFNTC